MRSAHEIQAAYSLDGDWSGLTAEQAVARLRDMGAALEAAGHFRDANAVKAALNKRGAGCCHPGCWEPPAAGKTECQAHINIRTKRGADDDYPLTEFVGARGSFGLPWRFAQ